MKFRNKTWFLTVVIALAHVYCSIKITKTINIRFKGNELRIMTRPRRRPLD